MYSRFYGFTTEPFQNTPDLDFLFLSTNHKEALACIEYGIRQRKGFIAITGEAGVGKTIILRSYLTKVDAQKQKTIYILNPRVSFDSVLTTILKELSAEPVAGPATQKLNQLHEVLIAEYRNDRTVVLIIDEAQNMPIETLESIRLLLNLETAKEKLIQMVFVGQPELDTLLNRYELRQVRERIALRARIAPLTKTESEDYIDHRLSLVRGEPRAVFSKQALDRIVKSANGIPRRLNILCDAVLIAGFEYRQAIISDRIAKEAIAVFNGVSQPARRLQPRYAVGMLSVVLMVVFYLVYLSTMPGITVSGPSEDTVQRKEPPKPVLGTIGTDQLFARDRDPDSVPPARLVSELETKQGSDLSPEERMELSETARLLAVLLDSGRVVLGRAQPTINNPRIGDKGFSSSVFEGQLRAEFQTRTRHDLHNLAVAPMPESAKHLLLRLAFFMQKAVHDVQADINKKGIGFKGFIPATFGTQVAYSFSKDTGLKLRQIGPPGTEPRNPDNKPNEQEEQLLYAVQKNHPRVGDHIVEQQLADIRGVRVMLPLFYSKQCLACHGNPKGQVDISGYPKEGFKEGDLGGAISIVLSAQKKLTKSSE
ncbi:MAG TPA: AAA family ATPase [Anaerolineales bacterium]|nr:AAA family ATPase [Anaerolineales bacterium]